MSSPNIPLSQPQQPGFVDRARGHFDELRNKTTAFIGVAVLAATVACEAGTTDHNSETIPREPGATASPFPETTASKAAPSSSVTAPPSTYNDAEPANPENAQERRHLTTAEKSSIAKVSGFEGVRSAELEVFGGFATEKADVTVIGANINALPHDLEKIESNWRTAEAIAELGLEFSPEIKLGKGQKQEVPFQLVPANETPGANGKRQQHYIIFADNQGHVRELSGPLELGSGVAFTVNNYPEGASTTILAPVGEYQLGVAYNDTVLASEAINANSGAVITDKQLIQQILSGEIDISNVTHPDLVNPEASQQLLLLESMLRDIVAVSGGEAIALALAGRTHEQYIQLVRDSGYIQSFPSLAAKRLPIPKAAFSIAS